MCFHQVLYIYCLLCYYNTMVFMLKHFCLNVRMFLYIFMDLFFISDSQTKIVDSVKSLVTFPILVLSKTFSAALPTWNGITY